MAVIEQQYELASVADLAEHPENPRTGDVDVIADSIGRHGFYGALIVQKSTGHVLAGNHRLQAARRESISELPVIKIDCDDDTARRILLVDNRSAEVAIWDYEKLADVLHELQSGDDDLGALGWADHELEALLGAEWRPDPGSTDLEDYTNTAQARSIKIGDDYWPTVSEALDAARDGLDVADDEALAGICRDWLTAR